MKTTRFGLLAALALGAGACGDDAAEQYIEERSTEALPPGDAEEAVAAADDAGQVAGAAESQYLVRMVSLEGDMNGTAALTPSGDQTEVTVVLAGAPAEGDYPGHIHQGDSCEAIGDVRWPLEAVSASAAEGRSLTTLPVPMDSVMDGSTLVVFHQQDGQPVICGDIPVLPPNLPA